MKRSAHKVAVTGASGRYVKVHGAGDRIMLGEIGVGNRLNCGERLALVGQVWAGTLGAGATPSFDLMAEGEYGILPFVLAAVDRKSSLASHLRTVRSLRSR